MTGHDSSIKKASSYIAQYPVLRTFQSALYLTSLTDLFTQTPSRLLWEAFIQLSELKQCKVKKLAQGFNTAAQDSNLGSRSRESKAVPLSCCTLHRQHAFNQMLKKLHNCYINTINVLTDPRCSFRMTNVKENVKFKSID